MSTFLRRSAVRFSAPVAASERRGAWQVVLAYENEGERLLLVDLSHCPRWDLQDHDLGGRGVAGLSIPCRPGFSRLEDGVLVSRMNATQASVWHLGGFAVELPNTPALTDVTDATVFLALFGAGLFGVTEQLSNLDLAHPPRPTPRLVQGPFSQVPCQIVVLSPAGPRPGILLTCSRGYAKDMVESILLTGKHDGIRPAGETAFKRWLQAV